MPDIATIGAFLTSIKTATEIAKALREVDVSLEKAETKLKIAGPQLFIWSAIDVQGCEVLAFESFLHER